MKVDIPQNKVTTAAAAVIGRLRSAGFNAWFVGGTVRDMLLGKTPKDVDIVTAAKPREVENIFDHVREVGVSFGVMLVKYEDIWFEVATLREERNYLDGRRPAEVKYTSDPEVDVMRRDFTVNGLLCDPFNGEVIDFVDGIADLEQGILRTIGPPEIRFNEDYLRMLRAVRFAARLRLDIEKDTLRFMKKMAAKTGELAIERVRDELTSMLTGSFPARAMRLLAECGMLAVILPEIDRMRGVTQPPEFHPEGDVFEHTMLMLEHMVLPSPELAWCVLLHDVGKPDTYFKEPDGRERFFKHEHLGAEMSEAVLRRLKAPNRLIETVSKTVRNHMRFAAAGQMKAAKLKKMMAVPEFSLELELHRIDCISSHCMLDVYNFLLDRLVENEGVTELPEPFLRGKDLIKLGLMPGPDFKLILDKVRDGQLAGSIVDRAAAIEFVKNHFHYKK
ncbi:CCA tRNA nucleotidyltransferase [Lentisphaerota bacterium ZTH]|nr:CCA tRNA nucleotidyltransferase [Lentisphaerota bacterium]WET05158.1 CCA tRNA nucleotidyltransferase [Lentisphaerota bacterium ZTH]